MDNTLSTLGVCEKLSLSTNMIDKIYGISGMKNLRILSLGRNYIKQISGLEGVSDTLEELWLSYNLIEKLKVALYYLSTAIVSKHSIPGHQLSEEITRPLLEQQPHQGLG